MANFKDGRAPDAAGSDYTDLGGASRMVPLALYYGDDPEIFIRYADQQTAMTHNHPQVRESARFFAAAAIEAIKTGDALASLEAAQRSLPGNSAISEMVIQGLESVNTKTEQAVIRFWPDV